MRVEHDVGVAPAEGYVRVMPLRLRQVADPVHKPDSFREIGELEITFDARCVVRQGPLRHLLAVASSLAGRQRRHATSAWHAGFVG